MDQKPVAKLGKRTMKTRSMNVKSITQHSPDSEMHRAIDKCDKELVTKLLKQGDKLCNGNDESLHGGTNCFMLHCYGDWEFTKFLLSLDPEAGIAAKDSDGYTLLILYAKYHKTIEVQHLLQVGADPNVRCNIHGHTALTLAMCQLYTSYAYRKKQCKKRKVFGEKCKHIVDLLIQSGADVNICDMFGRNALHIAVTNSCTFQLEIVRSLINAGIDPTVETNKHCTVLSIAMKSFVDLCDEFRDDFVAREVYPALHYLFNLPQFQSHSFQLRCEDARHPQVILLKHLIPCQLVTGKQSIFVDLIGSNLKNPELVVMDQLQDGNFDNPNHKFDRNAKLPFGPLALYLNFEEFPRTLELIQTKSYDLLRNVQHLQSLGFGVNVKDRQTISPLTVGLICQLPQFDYVTFAKIMLNSGVHVEQRMLKYERRNQELERLSAELCLPDALRVVLSQTRFHPIVVLELVKLFLPHFAHPGWALLPFITSPEKVAALFPLLSSCGALQHTALHNAVKAHILNFGLLSEQNLQTFIELNSCVPKLQELCRTMGRAQLARQACQHGNSLPALIKSVPPLVTPLNRLLDVAPFLE